jgi:hypothetical protein
MPCVASSDGVAPLRQCVASTQARKQVKGTYPADAERIAGLIAKVVGLIAVAAGVLSKSIVGGDAGVHHRCVLNTVTCDGGVEYNRL